METEIIPAPRTNGHADGYRRLDQLERQVGELGEQLRAAHDRIDELEEKLSPEGFPKFLQRVQRAELSKKLEDPEQREELIDLMLGQQQG